MPTPGCIGCVADSCNHSRECIAPFEKAFGKKHEESEAPQIEALEDLPGVGVLQA